MGVQGALIGEVTPNLAAVTCGIRDKCIALIAYFDGKLVQDDIERIQVIATEVIADFPDGYTIHEESKSLHEGELQMLDFWAFMRAGLK